MWTVESIILGGLAYFEWAQQAKCGQRADNHMFNTSEANHTWHALMKKFDDKLYEKICSHQFTWDTIKKPCYIPMQFNNNKYAKMFNVPTPNDQTHRKATYIILH